MGGPDGAFAHDITSMPARRCVIGWSEDTKPCGRNAAISRFEGVD